MIALYIYLLIAAALLIQSLIRFGNQGAGFEGFCTGLGLCLLWPIALFQEAREAHYQWMQRRGRH